LAQEILVNPLQYGFRPKGVGDCADDEFERNSAIYDKFTVLAVIIADFFASFVDFLQNHQYLPPKKY
jgi:hypothetical protein